MKTHLNYWAIVLAAVSAFVVGGIWYKVFAGPWKKANSFSEEPPAANPAKIFGISFLLSLVMSLNWQNSSTARIKPRPGVRPQVFWPDSGGALWGSASSRCLSANPGVTCSSTEAISPWRSR